MNFNDMSKPGSDDTANTLLQNTFMDVTELEELRTKASRYDVICEDYKRELETIKQLERQLADCKDYGRRLLEVITPTNHEVIKLIAEQGSHAWRNERTLTAIFKMLETIETVRYLTGKIQTVDVKRDAEWEF